MTKKKLLVVTNIVLIGILILVSVKEKYFQKIIYKISSTDISQDYSFKNNWKYQQEIDLYNIYQKDAKIVMLGNSITYRCNWNELLNRNDIINRGIGSDITEGFLNRLKYVYNTNPEICFVMGGVNDLSIGIEPEVIANNILVLIKSLREKEIKPVIQSILYVADDYPNANEMNNQIKATNQLLSKICLNKQETYWDLNKVFNNQHYLRKEYSFDGIHLTAKAYRKWGKKIEQFLNDYEIEKSSK